MASLDQYFVFHPGGIRQLFDPRQVGAGHAAGDGNGDPCRAGGGDAAGLRSGRARNRGAGAPVQLVDLDELGEDSVDSLHRLRHHDRGTERGHGAGDIDDAAQAELRTDVGSVRGHGGDL
jgi:hypothetical protein